MLDFNIERDRDVTHRFDRIIGKIQQHIEAADDAVVRRCAEVSRARHRAHGRRKVRPPQ